MHFQRLWADFGRNGQEKTYNLGFKAWYGAARVWLMRWRTPIHP